jgi:hypothetical protein
MTFRAKIQVDQSMLKSLKSIFLTFLTENDLNQVMTLLHGQKAQSHVVQKVIIQNLGIKSSRRVLKFLPHIDLGI